MKTFLASVLLVAALPFAASAQDGTAPPGANLTKEQLIALAEAHGVCGEQAVIEAQMEADGRVTATCGQDAEGFVPLALGGLGAGGAAAAAAAGLVAAAAVAGGGGGSTPDTQ